MAGVRLARSNTQLTFEAALAYRPDGTFSPTGEIKFYEWPRTSATSLVVVSVPSAGIFAFSAPQLDRWRILAADAEGVLVAALIDRFRGAGPASVRRKDLDRTALDELEGGTLSRRRIWGAFEQEWGYPDGMTTDADGWWTHLGSNQGPAD